MIILFQSIAVQLNYTILISNKSTLFHKPLLDLFSLRIETAYVLLAKIVRFTRRQYLLILLSTRVHNFVYLFVNLSNGNPCK